MMKIIKKIKEMQKIVKEIKQKNKKIGFVPTMGALHEGHISLIRKARSENDILIVSIFVNPKQFGPREDYLRYPRPFQKDKKILMREKVDFLFYPSLKEMYPNNYLTYTNVEKLSNILEGKFRPGHFKGVTTVVSKLFNIVSPDNAYFGEKDYQQLKIIEKMINDLNFPINIIACKTIRENDGLALSSRNLYLDETSRNEASKIYQALNYGKKLILEKKVKNPNLVINEIKKIMKKIKNCKIEYVKICDPQTLEELKKIKLPIRILTALWIKNTRLIDNISVE